MVTETSRAYPSRFVIIPDDSYTDLYAIFYDLNTGNMFNPTTGEIETTWATAAILATQHPYNKSVWLAATPPIEQDINLGMNLFQNASPADTDVVVKAVKYDPKFNLTYSDATPAAQGKTLTR